MGDYIPMRSFSRLFAGCVLAAALTACSDGKDGPAGPPGPPGPPGAPSVGVTDRATALDVDITGVTIASPPVVNFTLRNEAGIAFVGLERSGVRFTLAKLIPETNGDPSRWQSYINRVENPGVGPGTESTIQAAAENNGTLVNHGDGSYTYTFATDVASVTTPLAVPFEPGLTHRLGVQISGGGLPVTNAVHTWRPSDGATTNITQRDIVQTESCNECHNQLVVHGGRIEVQYCVTCHNPGSTDANSGNTVDFRVMVHKIHMGKELPSVQAGGEYAIWGFRDTKHDYSTVAYPQDQRNCIKCHSAEIAATPQGGHWETQPSREACGSCHDDVNFETGEGHSAGNFVAQNSECTICHTDNGFVGSVAQSHVIPSMVAAQRFRFNILDVANTAPGEFPVMRFSVTDPTSGDAPYDIKNDPEWTGGAITANFGWDNRDHHNTGGGASAWLPVSVNARTASVDNGDGSFTVTAPEAVPADVTGSGVATLWGRAADDFDGDGVFGDRVPIRSTVSYFAVTDPVPVPRRQVVDIAKCHQCHDRISIHGAARTDEPQVCSVCHNPNATDIARRPVNPGDAVDGKAEESIHFKTMIHGIHAARFRENDLVIYGFGNTPHNFGKVRYPGILSDCATCHVPNTFGVPLPDGVLATTIDTGPSRTDPHDDLNITAAAAACASCHDGDLARSHMEQNGASFMTPQSMVDNGSFIETCAVCHGDGRVADVAQLHRIRSSP